MNVKRLRIVLGLFLLLLTARGVLAAPARPNVLVIITDDQGYGDFGCHGNPVIRTPNLDKLARASVRLERFHVSPVCAPTRSSLLTGRYNYRTRVVDTFIGRAMMDPEEVTLAEMLAAAGYRTGIFGKWHLGDNYPMRPIDQGFHEALVLKGGGIGQSSDPPVPGGDSYFDPILQHNGRQVKTKGYCSNVFTDAAIDFITANRDRPFFAYLAFNCPHTPLQVSDEDYLPYKALNLAHDQFPKVGQPLPGRADQDLIARVYGMVSNIDANLGRLFAQLDSLRLAENTIVVFLTDNGPQQVRYNSGLRDRKGSVYDGGIHVPCFVRWPDALTAGRTVDRIAAHIDIAPTLLDACGVPKPESVTFDGVSLLPLLKGENVAWPDRTLYFQWHRGDEPELFRACAARSQRYKLVQPEAKTKPELYDMEADPFEFHDLAAEHPEVVARMRAGYEAWFRDVSVPRGYAPPRIVLGASAENPSELTRQDWRGPRAGGGPRALGHWEVQVARAGNYDITLRFDAPASPASAHFALGAVTRVEMVEAGTWTFRDVPLAPGPGRLEAWIEDDKGAVGVHYVDVNRRD